MSIIYSDFKPTILMVEKHNTTNKLYFHKTHRLEIKDTYFGSGPYWLNHLKSHGNNVSRLWESKVFHNPEEIKEFALNFSEIHNIAESEIWANQQPEDGLGGGAQFDSHTQETKIKMSEKRMEYVNDSEWNNTVWKETRQKIRDTLNDSEWKNTVGKISRQKYTETFYSKEWQENVGKQKFKNHSEALKQLYANEEWRETVGKQKKEKCVKAALNRKKYKCHLCDKHPLDGGNFSQHMGMIHSLTKEEIKNLKNTL